MTRFLLVALLLPAHASALPFVERLEPPVLQRGKTTRLTAIGSGLANLAGLWTSLGGKIEAKPAGKDAFDVRVAADAPVGVFGLRVATADGLGNMHLCLIDDLPVKPVVDGAAVETPCALWGRFREGESDTFTIDVKAGQRVSFEAVGSRLGKEVDPLVTIRDARGKMVAQRDNDAGLYFDCRFEHAFAEAGKYTVEMRDARFQGHPHGSWVLRMGRFAAARVALPAVVSAGTRAKVTLPELGDTVEADIPASVPNGPLSLTVKRPGDEGSAWLPVEVGPSDAVTDTAIPTIVPAHLCGVLGKGGKGEPYRLLLVKGQSFHAVAHGRRLNSSIDLELSLVDPAGREVTRAIQGEDDRALLNYNAPAAGVYLFSVRDAARAGGPACSFRVELRSEPPPPVVAAEVEGLTVPRGDWQPVPLVATRNGHAGAITLTLEGAPEGVTLTPNEIPVGKDAVVCQMAATSKAVLGLHNVRIWGQAAKGGRFLVRSRPLIDRQLRNVDLIPYTLREDQRRLPATVSGEIALMVTEPSPFTFDIKDPTVTLARYQQALIPVLTTRAAGFDAPIAFTARGGQLDDKREGRTRLYAEFPTATAKTLEVAGSVHSRILANTAKSRIEVAATASHGARRITLVRTFELDVRPAFSVKTDKEPLKLMPGTATRATVRVERVKTFAGPVAVALSPQDGLECPEKVTVPAGMDSVEVEVRARADLPPGRRSIGLNGTADVDGFEEETRGDRIEVEVPRPATPKKK